MCKISLRVNQFLGFISKIVKINKYLHYNVTISPHICERVPNENSGNTAPK